MGVLPMEGPYVFLAWALYPLAGQSLRCIPQDYKTST